MVRTAFVIPLGSFPPSKSTSPRSGLRSNPALNSFVGDQDNALIQVMVAAFLKDESPYSPLVITGPQGVGKSFLASGLAGRWNDLHSHAKALYLTAQDFSSALADALETDTLPAFRARFTRSPALVIDGLESLAPKIAAQLELVQLLDLAQAPRQRYLLTCRGPLDLPDFHPALVSRLHGGLVVPIGPPGPAARQVILRELLGKARLRLDSDALSWFAEHVGRDLSGHGLVPRMAQLVWQLAASDEAARQPWTLRTLQAQLRDDSATTTDVGLRDIARAVCDNFGITLAELKGKSRRRQVVQARGLAVYLARRMTRESLESLGRFFGGRDHTTTMHACRTTEERLANDPVLQRAAAVVTERLRDSIAEPT